MAIVKFHDAHQKAEGAIGRLENTSLTCFICNQEDDGAPKSYRLHKCCAAHHVCNVHKTKKDLITRHEEGRGGFTVLKCACAGCRADALWPLVPLDTAVCDMNENVHKTLVHVKVASEASKEIEKECDKEIATVRLRADNRVAKAEADLSGEQAKVHDLERRLQQQQQEQQEQEPAAAAAAPAGIRDMEEGEEKDAARAKARADRQRLAKKQRIEETREELEDNGLLAILASVRAGLDGCDALKAKYDRVMAYREEGPAKKPSGRKRKAAAAGASWASAVDVDEEGED